MKFKPGTVIELHPSNFDTKTKTINHSLLNGKKGMIAFMADFCGHCRRFAPDYEKVSKTMGTNFPCFYLDCERYSSLASELGINGFPTILYINKRGKIYKSYNGDRSVSKLVEDICIEYRKN